MFDTPCLRAVVFKYLSVTWLQLKLHDFLYSTRYIYRKKPKKNPIFWKNISLKCLKKMCLLWAFIHYKWKHDLIIYLPTFQCGSEMLALSKVDYLQTLWKKCV